MNFILIDENNIILEMYETDDIEKIKKQKEYKPNYKIELQKDYHYKGLNLNRVVNNKILSNKEAVKRGLIKLKENEVLINDNIVKLEKTQKIVNNEIAEKTDLEKLNDGIINQEEYNNIQDDKRQKSYKNETDNLLMDLINSYFENRKDTLTESELKILDTIESKKKFIKDEYPKAKLNYKKKNRNHRFKFKYKNNKKTN